MKKYLFLLVTLIMMGVGTANAQKVYVSDTGTVYHKEKGCTTLKQAKKVNTVSIEDAKKKKGIRPCKVCYADKKAKKAIGRKPATAQKPAAAKKPAAQKPAEKKVTKKALPARDEKGRFIKKK